MKKILAVIALMTMLWSCKKVENTNSGLQNPIKVTSGKLPISKTKADPIYNLLGYGYDVTGEFARANSARGKVLNLYALENDYPSAVEFDDSGFSDGLIVAGSNAVAFSKGLTHKVGVDSSNNSWFKGSINYSFSDSSSFSSKYIYAFYDKKIQRERKYIVYPTSLLQNYLDPTFVSMIATQTPEEIVELYGTHVLGDILLGGVLQVVFQSETTHSDRKTAATAGINISIANVFNINAGGSTSSSEASDNFQQKIHYKMAGGDPSSRVSGTVSVDPTNTIVPVNIDSWISSCTPQNADLIDFGPTNKRLIPIYELISDPVKKAAVQSYVTQYLFDNRVTMFTDRVPIYQYYSPSLDGYQYFPESNRGSTTWVFEGRQFHGALPGAPNSVEITVYWNQNKQDWYYSLASQDFMYRNYVSFHFGLSLNARRYNSQGPRFRAFANQEPGTIPIYQHCRANDVHFLSTTSWFPNMKMTEIAFYAYPN